MVSLTMAHENNPPACVACRRRLRVSGKPVFVSCMCQSYGRVTTVTTLAVTGLVLVALAVRVARTRP